MSEIAVRRCQWKRKSATRAPTMVPEAALEKTDAGLWPVSSGWFVTLAQDPRYASEVAVEFVPGEGEGEPASDCTLRFAHGGWTDANVAARKKFGDWRVMLDRFAALAESDG
jgi:hypothetical protein